MLSAVKNPGCRKGDDLKYSNNSSFQLAIPFLYLFLSSLNCITDSGRCYVKFLAKSTIGIPNSITVQLQSKSLERILFFYLPLPVM